jgi:hypothetical protein
MLGRAVLGALLLILTAFACLPVATDAQEPPASNANPECDAAVSECAGPRPGEVRVIPSRPTELADGHEGQSVIILASLSLLAFGGLVVSVLNRLALDDA